MNKEAIHKGNCRIIYHNHIGVLCDCQSFCTCGAELEEIKPKTVKEEKKVFKDFTLGMFRQWFGEDNENKTYTAKELWEMLNQASPLEPLKEEEKKCEHSGECYKKIITGSNSPFGYCKFTPQPTKEGWEERFLKEFPIEFKEYNLDSIIPTSSKGQLKDRVKQFISQEIKKVRQEGYRKGTYDGYKLKSQQSKVEIKKAREEGKKVETINVKLEVFKQIQYIMQPYDFKTIKSGTNILSAINSYIEKETLGFKNIIIKEE